jgi:hypothetical protein
MPAHQEDVQYDEQHEGRGQKDDVRAVPACKRERANGGPTAKNAGDDLTRDRRQLRNIDRDDSCPIRALIPGQQISGQ